MGTLKKNLTSIGAHNCIEWDILICFLKIQYCLASKYLFIDCLIVYHTSVLCELVMLQPCTCMLLICRLVEIAQHKFPDLYNSEEDLCRMAENVLVDNHQTCASLIKK